MPKGARTSQILHAYLPLLFLSVCAYALMYAPQPMFNAVSQEFGIDRTTTGLTVSVFMLSLAISPLCVGLVLGKVGLKRSIVASLILIALSGVIIPLTTTFGQFLAIRFVQGLLVPVLLTALMTTIAKLFRHLDLSRALAGYIASNLFGTLLGRLACGVCAEHFGWRYTMLGVCLIFLGGLFVIKFLPKESPETHPRHKISEYCSVLGQKNLLPLILVEACGIFVFAAMGNLIPFRMAELGQGQSESLVGFMYLGYSVGLIASGVIGPLTRLLGTTRRFLIFASAFYFISFLGLTYPSVWVLFGSLWLVAGGQFLVHSRCPSLINQAGTKSGQCDRSLVNGLFLSIYYLGGVLGTLIPPTIYTYFGWFACYGLMQLVLLAAFLIILFKCKQIG